MSPKPKGGDLFIVDNSISGWTGLRYLQEWSELAKSFDIATGLFEIGSLLDLDGKWQQLEKIRILMGEETTHRTKQALLEAVKARAEESLDKSLEANKEENPFLNGVPAVVEALKSGQIECRVYIAGGIVPKPALVLEAAAEARAPESPAQFGHDAARDVDAAVRPAYKNVYSPSCVQNCPQPVNWDSLI